MIVALSSLGLVMFVLAMVISAGPRIHAENDSIMRLAKEFVETTVDSLQGTPDPGARLEVLLAGLKELRHVHIYRINDHTPHAAPEEPVDGDAPAWLARLGRPRRASRCRSSSTDTISGRWCGAAPFRRGGRDLGLDRQLQFGRRCLAVAAVLLMSIMIAYLLRPIKSVGDALMVLEAGRYDVVVPEKGPPEISDICRKLNRLAATLEHTIAENRRLAQRIIFVQDEERKDLARELHDELGPYLFAIRAAVSAHKGELQRGASERKAADLRHAG